MNEDRYVNFYQVPGTDKITSSIHNSREDADHYWNNRWETYGIPLVNRVSRKERIACIRVPVMCIFGQFDM